jgi:hypothetical protein
MKNFFGSIILAVCCVLTISTEALAQKKKGSVPTPIPVSDPKSSYISSYSPYNFKHEVSLNLSEGLIRSYKIGDNSYTDFNVNGSYLYTWKDHMQVGGEVGLKSYASGGSSSNLMILMGVFTYNLEADFKNSFFGAAAAGLAPAYKKADGKFKSDFSFFFEAGKRFALWDHVTYRPLFRIAKYGEQDMEFLVLALNVSLMF